MSRVPDTIKRVRRTKYSGQPTVVLLAADELGPAMLGLNEQQRRFVLELATTAGRLLRSDKIQAALREIGIKS